jgi:hypothetical protein
MHSVRPLLLVSIVNHCFSVVLVQIWCRRNIFIKEHFHGRKKMASLLKRKKAWYVKYKDVAGEWHGIPMGMMLCTEI